MKSKMVVGMTALALALLVASPARSEEIGIQVSPSTINLGEQGTWVTVHADIPLAGVITATVMLNGVEVAWTKADSQGNLVAKFVVDDVRAIVAPPSATLELVGEVVTPEGTVAFSGSDSVRVIAGGKR
ncbi:MAG: hypothetical protein ACOY3P_21590 [Planctomycetota bacterium]